MRTRFACSVFLTVVCGGLWIAAAAQAPVRRDEASASRAQVKDFRPVTEEMLRNPAPGDWLNWRRTDNAWGYSPLDQITRQNVQQLAARVVVGDGRHRREGGDAAGVRRHHVPAEPARRHSGAGRRDRRLDLGVPAGSEARPRPRRVPAAANRPRSPAWRSGPPAAAIPAGASSETSPSSATRSSARPTTRTSSRSTRGPASWRGTPRSPIRSSDTNTPPARSSSAAR